MIEGPEVETHRHKTGHSHIDLILGGLAVVLSMVSVAIAFEHGKTMEKLVEANSWPNISYQTGNAHDGQDVISLTLRNTGVGPARIDTMEVFYKGVPQANALALLHACCAAGPQLHTSLGIDDVEDVVIPAREQIDFLTMAAAHNPQGIWDALNTERFNIRVRACYCSVFDECYVADSAEPRPHHVAQCAPSQPVQYRICGVGPTQACE